MSPRQLRCAIYTRKSSEEGLDQDFNSLDAQREACAAYIASQRQEGWRLVQTRYDDGGYSGGTLDRPALKQLLFDLESGKVDLIVVYKIDRLTRSLHDFAKLVDRLEAHQASFVSVTQSFNTTTSMGRLTLNVLLSFAQFEREVTGERIRDKIAASKQKGMWMGGCVPIGYDCVDRKLVVNPEEAKVVTRIFEIYRDIGNTFRLVAALKQEKLVSKARIRRNGERSGGGDFSSGALSAILKNRIYLGEITHKGNVYPGQHPAIIPKELWETVQEVLVRTRQRITTRAQARSPLRGLVIDELGRRYEPVHTTKGGRRYRYYVSKPEDNAKHPGSKQARLPGEELERHISTRLEQFLLNDGELFSTIGFGREPARHAAIQQTAHAVCAAEPEARWIQFRSAIHRIRVRLESIDLELSRKGLFKLLLGQDSELLGEEVEQPAIANLVLPVRLYRTGHDLRLVINNGPNGDEAGKQDPALMKWLARGRRWYQQLTSGEMPSLRAIASAEGITERFVSRVIAGSLLAPDIIEKVIQGRQPITFTVKSLSSVAYWLFCPYAIRIRLSFWEIM